MGNTVCTSSANTQGPGNIAPSCFFFFDVVVRVVPMSWGKGKGLGGNKTRGAAKGAGGFGTWNGVELFFAAPGMISLYHRQRLGCHVIVYISECLD